MKQQFLKSKAGTIKLLIYGDNRPVVPSAATITIYKPGDIEAFVSETAATVNAITGEMTYDLTSTHTETHGLNYKAEWKYTVSGTDYYQQQLFDVVKSILAIPIVDEDLYEELPSLRDQAYQVTGTATAGAAGSITDTSRREKSDDYWKGSVMEILTGTGASQKRAVATYTQSTGVFEVSPNWETNPDNTSVYRIVRSFSKQIIKGFEKISQMIYNKGKRHSLIIESSQIEIPLTYLVVHFICIDLMSESEDLWHTRALDYWEKFNTSFNSLKLDYDEDESGSITGDEEQSSQTSIWMSRS